MAEFSLDGTKFQSGTVEQGLYIVSTPIGNLSDISIRALKILASVSVIACEDTRTTGKLLKHFGIKTKMVPYHEHNAAKSGPKLVAALVDGKSVALVSDAGTPLISDPGYKLVATAREEEIKVFPVPGASAPMAALVASGLETDEFMFAGFLPSKTVARQKRLQELAELSCTLIFFESPKRLDASLDDMIRIFGENRKGCIARELTKLHEEVISEELIQLKEAYRDRKTRGEIVILIGAGQEQNEIDIDALLVELLATKTVSRAAAEAAKLTGKTKRAMYQRALKLSGA